MKLTTVIYKTAVKCWNIMPFKKLMAQAIRALRLPVDKLQRDLWFEGDFFVDFNNKNFKLNASRRDYSALGVFWDGLEKGWDAKSIYIWGELAKRANTVFDIGANIGLYALAAKTVNPSCKVYAFEPSEKILGILKSNVQLNNFDITVVPVALSNTKGETVFYDLSVPTAMSSIKYSDSLAKNKNLIEYRVNVNTFENYINEQEISQVDLVSIDVELNEPEVLEGMGGVIDRFRPDFIIEVLNNEVGDKIEQFFHGKNYSYYRIDEETGLIPVPHLKRESNSKDNGFNFLICGRDYTEYLSSFMKYY